MHAFSNGGCCVYWFLSDLIHNGRTSPSVTLRGIIFDSCPSPPNICRGVQVYMDICNHSFFVKYFVAMCMFVWLAVVMIVSRCRECIPFEWVPVDDYWDYMCNDPAVCPHLYLYSVKDAVINYKEVEQMIGVRRSRGVHVLTQRWDDSAHVAHLIAHRETYTTACLDFLQSCL